MRGALGSIRNRKTAQKFRPETEKQKMKYKSNKIEIFTDPDFQNLNLPDTLVAPGGYGVTVTWVSPLFGYPLTQNASNMGIPFSYYFSVLGIPRYPPGMPRFLAFWASPTLTINMSLENRKAFTIIETFSST